MSYPYLPQLMQWVRRSYETCVVVDLERIVANCRTLRNQYGHMVQHLYDLQALPTLTVVQQIHAQLSCQVAVPTLAWSAYVQQGGIPTSAVTCLQERTHWIVSRTDWLQWQQTIDVVSTDTVCLPVDLFCALIDAQAIDMVVSRHLQWVVDARSADNIQHEQLAQYIERAYADYRLQCTIWHGTQLLQSACTLWLTVRTIKRVHGRQYAILSGGTNVLWDAGQRGNAYRKKYLLVFPQHTKATADQVTTFCGPLCTPQDVLAVDVSAPPLHIGDLVALPNVGAAHYRSPLYFIGHPTPLELLYRHNRLTPAQQLPPPYPASTVQAP